MSAVLCHFDVEGSFASQDGSTPLHYAAAFGQAHIVGALIEAGCSVDSTDDAKNTPLHLAAGVHMAYAFAVGIPPGKGSVASTVHEQSQGFCIIVS